MFFPFAIRGAILTGCRHRSAPKPKAPKALKPSKPKVSTHPSVKVFGGEGSPSPSGDDELDEEEEEEEQAADESGEASQPIASTSRGTRTRPAVRLPPSSSSATPANAPVDLAASSAAAATSATRTEVQPVPRPTTTRSSPPMGGEFEELEGVVTAEQQAAIALVGVGFAQNREGGEDMLV
jgi:hypothetical protein